MAENGMLRTSSSSRALQPETFKSLGLQELCRLIQGSESCRILDLGGALGVNITFWSRFGPSIHVGDLQSAMPEPAPPAEDGTTRPARWDEILPLAEESRYDVILAWDLLNYLDQPLFAGLVQYLARFCAPSALVFALIYDRPQMPALPTSFKIRDEENLVYESRTAETRPCARHQPRDVQRMFSGFRVAGSFRLRHGVQEYLFQYE